MDREINVINYLPDFLKEFREFKALAEAENPELLCAWEAYEELLKNQFVNDAEEPGVKRWETILGLLPKGSDTLDTRRFRILTRLNEKLPYTRRILEQQLAALCGEGGYLVDIKNGEYTLAVRVAMAARAKFEEVGSLLGRIVPANMVIDLSLLYNRHSKLAGFTHAELSARTHEQLRNEVF